VHLVGFIVRKCYRPGILFFAEQHEYLGSADYEKFCARNCRTIYARNLEKISQ